MISAADRESLRRNYAFRCGYCGISETDSGGELTIDHHRPVVAEGTDDLANLVYACFRCNLFKGSAWPTDSERRAGIRILHPLIDALYEHYSVDAQTGLLVPTTDTGHYHIAALRLNRIEPIRHRLREQEIELVGRERDILASLVADYREWVETQVDIRDDLAARTPKNLPKKRGRN